MQEKIENVQALRGFAGVSVVIAHLGGLYEFDPDIPRIAVSAGVAGVDLFFVLSGFIIYWITRSDGWISRASFITDRLWRIIPLYWLLTIPELPWASIIAYGKDGYIFPNWQFYIKSFFLIPAFSPNSTLLYPALNTGWTLIYEAAFYSIWLILMAGARRHLLFRLTAAITIFYASGYMVSKDSAWNSFASNPIVFEFILGVAVAQIWEKKSGLSSHPSVSIILIILSILSIIVSNYFFGTDYRLLFFGVPSAIILFSALNLERARITASPIVMFIGDASFAIYLAQARTIAIMTEFLKPFAIFWPFKLMFIVISAMAVGIALHLIFERPVKRWRRLIQAHHNPAYIS